MEIKQTNKLATFARNLNQEIINNKSDPIIGRENEIRKVIEVLNRKNKNNPVLIGEPGVGKTAIVEGLAQRIVNKDVPDSLKDKEVWELSLSSLISGASYQGEFEQRINSIINEVKKSDGRIILFIDEIHQLVGMGKTQGSMDAANILKPMMARGEIKLIGATTLKEYRENIEKDPALERRMTKIIVEEPSKQEALTIMRGLKERWEVFHGVKIKDSALVAAVELSEKYITDRYLPDKAIDLIDEACAKIQIEMHSLPEELDQIKRTIIHLETERAALSKENTEKALSRLKEIEPKLDDLRKRDNELSSEWNKAKANNESLIKIKSEIEQAKNNVERFQSIGEYAQASALLYVKIPELEKQKEELEAKIISENKNLITDVVTDLEIGEVISKSIGIPLNKIVESEKDKLINLKNELLKYIKGQDEAVSLVSSAVLRGRTGINDPNKPIGSFLFLGPTGVGKTELSKALSTSLFDSTKNLIRFDMSEYMEKHSVSKLIGAPPGYIGYEEAGLLTESVRRKPYSVILFDEIEKAHNDVLNLLLQILDEGQIKDSHGKLINFKNTIIIMTSNIGAKEILDDNLAKAQEKLKIHLKPELLNRIDEIIWFNPLEIDVISEIVKKLLDELSIRMLDNNFKIKFDKSVVSAAVAQGYDKQYGARPLKRWIQKNIENQLAELIVLNKINKQDEYNIKYNNKTDMIEIKE